MMLRILLPLIFCLALIPLRPLDARELSEKQRGITDRYVQLEQVLLRMSEASATSDPKRATLLKKVLLASKDKLVSIRMEALIRLLEQKRLTETAVGQEEVENDLLELLRLLESENREQRRTAEKERIKQFLREVEELIHQEKALKARTSQQERKRLETLEKEQRNVRNQAQSLRDKIEENENSADGKSETKPDDRDEADSKAEELEKREEHEKGASREDDLKKQGSAEEKSGEKSGKEERKEEKESDSPAEEKSEKKSGKEERKPDAENVESAEKAEQGKKEDQNLSPTSRAMREAVERMKQAEQKLQTAEKSGAIEEQEEAIAQLQRVKAELERILRQIREEELLQTLEKLEARFKRMLRVEQAIRSGTEKLVEGADRRDESERRQVRIQAARLASDQQSVTDDADAALILLREDGTAQAMVESLLQARFDMTEIATRLNDARLDSTTLDVQDAVIAALREMLEAIDLAVQEAKKREENPTSPPAGAEGSQEDEPLIQLLSELRMIRSMQRRVNDRTERYEKEVERLKGDAGADLESLRAKVEELARQQNRISRILHDLKIGRIQ